MAILPCGPCRLVHRLCTRDRPASGPLLGPDPLGVTMKHDLASGQGLEAQTLT